MSTVMVAKSTSDSHYCYVVITLVGSDTNTSLLFCCFCEKKNLNEHIANATDS